MDNVFVDVYTMYQENERNLDELGKCYQSIDKLSNKIHNILFSRIQIEQVDGKNILLKPNWVKHPSKDEDRFCLTTDESFILATTKAILQHNPKTITIGDAPIQGCDWTKMISQSFNQELCNLETKYNIAISVIDFRRVKFDPEKNVKQTDIHDINDFVILDVGEKSYLEPITTTKNKFRVTQYDPEKFKETHAKGMHKYCITKHLFEADLVISLPKAKTHQKAGITAALKNIVGLNGDKDFLPHHRIGGDKMGGDAYPGKSYLRYVAELCYDNAYKTQGSIWYKYWMRMGSLLWKLSFPNKEQTPGAAWYGNDTVWRMVMDLNTIVLYGRNDGTISSLKQRTLYSLCDGIIGGEGDGPLHPEPFPFGFISFTDDSAWHDIAIAHLMQFDPMKISLLRAARHFSKSNTLDLTMNGKAIDINELGTYSIQTKPAPGWESHLG